MSMQTSIRLCPDPLDVSVAMGWTNQSGIGGLGVFVGITRPENDATLGELVGLEYHAYDEMALAEMRKLCDAAAAQWPILHAVVWHRLGLVKVGEASVVIVVGAAHRGDALCACRYLIDELKKSVPIWKKEIYTSDSRWKPEP